MMDKDKEILRLEKALKRAKNRITSLERLEVIVRRSCSDALIKRSDHENRANESHDLLCQTIQVIKNLTK